MMNCSNFLGVVGRYVILCLIGIHFSLCEGMFLSQYAQFKHNNACQADPVFDGSSHQMSIANINLHTQDTLHHTYSLGDYGASYELLRPLESERSYPLYVRIPTVVANSAFCVYSPAQKSILQQAVVTFFKEDRQQNTLWNEMLNQKVPVSRVKRNGEIAGHWQPTPHEMAFAQGIKCGISAAAAFYQELPQVSLTVDARVTGRNLVVRPAILEQHLGAFHAQALCKHMSTITWHEYEGQKVGTIGMGELSDLLPHAVQDITPTVLEYGLITAARHMAHICALSYEQRKADDEEARESYQKQNKELQDKKEELEGQLRKMRQERDRLKKEKKGAEEDKTGLVSFWESSERAISQAHEETKKQFEEIGVHLENAQQISTKHTQTLSEVAARVKEAEEKCTHLMAEIDQVEKTLESAQKNSTPSPEEHAFEATHEQKIKELERELQCTKEKLEGMRMAYADEWSKAVHFVNKNDEKAKERIEHIQEDAARTVQWNKERLEAALRAKEKQLVQVQKHVQTLTEKLEQASVASSSDVESIRSALKGVQAEHAKYVSLYENLKKEKEDGDKQLAEFQHLYPHLSKQMEKLLGETETLPQTNEKNEAEIKRLTELHHPSKVQHPDDMPRDSSGEEGHRFTIPHNKRSWWQSCLKYATIFGGGCGWGALSLWIWSHPDIFSRVTLSSLWPSFWSSAR